MIDNEETANNKQINKKEGDIMVNSVDKKQDPMKNKNTQQNECPKKDKDGNCLVPGVYSDSDPIGGA